MTVHRTAGALEIQGGKMARKQKGRQLRAQPDFHLGRDWLECWGWELSACLNLLNAAPSHIKNSSNISFITAREWREGNRCFILLSRVGDTTLPPNYFDISVKWCSLYAHTVRSVLAHINLLILTTLCGRCSSSHLYNKETGLKKFICPKSHSKWQTLKQGTQVAECVLSSYHSVSPKMSECSQV